jgi:hypothetical protein
MTKIKDMIRGDTRSFPVTFYDSDGVTPLSLVGGTVKFTVNATEEPSDNSAAVIQKTITVHTSPLNGQTTIALSSSDTNITPGEYYYDVQLTDASGNVLSKKKDILTVISDITR